jgi:hypothetical protein
VTHKYHARPQTTEDGFFASKAELRRYRELQLLEKAGTISNLERQPQYALMTIDTAGECVPIVIGKRYAKYVGDFRYTDLDGATVVEDVKGVDTPTSKLKRAIVKASYGIDVQLVSGRKRR